jgi:hypothetical protein
MDNEKSTPLNDHPDPALPIPTHPFFELTGDRTSFSHCLDVIDRVNAVIELFSCLKLNDEVESGLTPKAANGYFWVSSLMGGALSYVSDRLIMLNTQHKKRIRQNQPTSRHCSTLCLY